MSIITSSTLVYYSCIVFMTVGVVASRRLYYHDDDAEETRTKPIELAEARRICASLCISGLGGKPCGESCASIQPAQFSSSSRQSTKYQYERRTNNSKTNDDNLQMPKGTSRRDACPILCQYHLGEPLCQCPFYYTDNVDSYNVDYNRICAYFCIEHRYNLHGCRSCAVYNEKDIWESPNSQLRRVRPTVVDMDIDWEAWCREKCSQGDGGAACNCDLLPLVLSSRNGTVFNLTDTIEGTVEPIK